MKADLVGTIKEAMGYMTPAPSCSTCAHSETRQDEHVERQDNLWCILNPSFNFIISPGAVCAYHEGK